MNSELSNPRAVWRIRHNHRPRLLTVLRVQDLSRNLRRVTLGGTDLEGFVSAAPDDHIKLYFFSEGTAPLKPEAGPNGTVWPEGTERPPARDYTPRRFDPETLELDIEFVMHGEGPAALWAARAAPGTQLMIGGPRGSTIVPPRPGGYLLIADESGLPAAARWLESLPALVPVTALFEVEDLGSELPVETQATLSRTWVHRNGRVAGTSQLLLDALRRSMRPPGDFFAWVACESGESRVIRRFLEDKWRLDPDSLKTAGYWKHGVADFDD